MALKVVFNGSVRMCLMETRLFCTVPRMVRFNSIKFIHSNTQ